MEITGKNISRKKKSRLFFPGAFDAVPSHKRPTLTNAGFHQPTPKKKKNKTTYETSFRDSNACVDFPKKKNPPVAYYLKDTVDANWFFKIVSVIQRQCG